VTFRENFAWSLFSFQWNALPQIAGARATLSLGAFSATSRFRAQTRKNCRRGDRTFPQARCGHKQERDCDELRENQKSEPVFQEED